MHLEELPLFPLNTVVFPYAQIQIHVFEERYKELVNWCLEYDNPFGVVLIRSGPEVGGTPEPYMVGTVCRILNTQRYEDGCMDVQVAGERRFRIRQLDETQPYLLGKVEAVIEAEMEETPENLRTFGEAREICQIFVQTHFRRQGLTAKAIFPENPIAFSFALANLVSLDNLDKQRMLETTDTVDRVESLLPVLRRQCVEESETTFFRLSSEMIRDELYPN